MTRFLQIQRIRVLAKFDRRRYTVAGNDLEGIPVKTREFEIEVPSLAKSSLGGCSCRHAFIASDEPIVFSSFFLG